MFFVVARNEVDYFATIASIVGYKFSPSKQRPIDGIDLMPVIYGNMKERGKSLFFGFRRFHDGTDGKSIISGDHKLLQKAKKNGRTRLYDLSVDPLEQHDLSETEPELLKTLTDKLKVIEASCRLSRDAADYSC